MQKGQFTKLYLDGATRRSRGGAGGSGASGLVTADDGRQGRKGPAHFREVDLKNIKAKPLSEDVIHKLNALWLEYFQTLKPHLCFASDVANNLRRIELVGAQCTIVSAKNSTLLHRRGTIVAETQGLLGLQTTAAAGAPKIIYVPKADCLFQIHTHQKLRHSETSADFVLNGQALNRDITIRTKSKPKRLWSLVS